MKILQNFFVALIMVLACLLSGCVTDSEQNVTIVYVGGSGTGHFSTIQEAIDFVEKEYTIFVHEGTYFENLFVDKSITLIGENRSNTIIDGGHIGDVVVIEDSSTVNIAGFTIQNSGPDNSTKNNAGIKVYSNNNSIENNIFYNNSNGIYSTYAEGNIYKNNLFMNNSMYGMYLFTLSDYSIITDNIFYNNYCGLRIKGSAFNNITRNIFEENQEGMYFCCSARPNIVYHNTFLNNNVWNADDQVNGNIWDGYYPIGGNYWDDYEGIDLYSGINQTINGSDGIGDSPYLIPNTFDKYDRYPLMEPIVP